MCSRGCLICDDMFAGMSPWVFRTPRPRGTVPPLLAIHSCDGRFICVQVIIVSPSHLSLPSRTWEFSTCHVYTTAHTCHAETVRLKGRCRLCFSLPRHDPRNFTGCRRVQIRTCTPRSERNSATAYLRRPPSSRVVKWPCWLRMELSPTRGALS